MNKLTKVGDYGTYIKDYGFRIICELSKEAAFEWVKCSCPSNTNIGVGTEANVGTLTLDNINRRGWLNKLFIIVALGGDDIKYAINHNGRNFSLYRSFI